MLRLLRNNKGQNTAEYAIVVGLVIAAAVGMQIYAKRGINAKVKSGTDLLTSITGTIQTEEGETFTLGTETQYEPYYLSSDFDSTGDSTQTETTSTGGGVARTGITDSSSRTGSQIIGEVEVQ